MKCTRVAHYIHKQGHDVIGRSIIGCLNVAMIGGECLECATFSGYSWPLKGSYSGDMLDNKIKATFDE